MKYRDNPLLDGMFDNIVTKEATPKTIQVRVTEREKEQYQDLMRLDVDMPYMIREFIRKMHDRVA